MMKALVHESPGMYAMERNRLNFLVDLAIFLNAIFLVTTGLIMRYVMPPGTGGRLQLLGMGRHEWGSIHFWLAVGVGLFLLAHVVMHWPWVCSMFSRMLRPAGVSSVNSPGWTRSVYGCVTLVLVVALLFGLVWLARLSVVKSGGGEHRWNFGFEGSSER